MRREKREREKRERLKEKVKEKLEERVLTCIRCSPLVNLRILPIRRLESWARTTRARILQPFGIHEACHAQPLSRSRYIYRCTYIFTNIHVHAYIQGVSLE